ncbi:UNKNOWN [Stylonychia lemnae]|uniref:PH domain-containing protein n=1 Tax=Stylonychia lemnae TaxID=5949 RepID=A0A078B4K4_STYLE|nr:UNKNOWN [Stylonychia lemnae]|eukprot:CDW88428.1 UNKNOWN [Stylonychia lemnae]
MGICGSKSKAPVPEEILELPSPTCKVLPLLNDFSQEKQIYEDRDECCQVRSEQRRVTKLLNSQSQQDEKMKYYENIITQAKGDIQDEEQNTEENHNIVSNPEESEHTPNLVPEISDFNILHETEHELNVQEEDELREFITNLENEIVPEDYLIVDESIDEQESFNQEEALKILTELEIQQPAASAKKNKIIFNLSQQDKNLVIFESAISKYHAGVNLTLIDRWCTVTKQGFAYYKNQWSSIGPTSKPISYIPIETIKTVCRVNYKLEDSKKKLNSGGQKFFQLEIFLKNVEIKASQNEILSQSINPLAAGLLGGLSPLKNRIKSAVHKKLKIAQARYMNPTKGQIMNQIRRQSTQNIGDLHQQIKLDSSLIGQVLDKKYLLKMQAGNHNKKVNRLSYQNKEQAGEDLTALDPEIQTQIEDNIVAPTNVSDIKIKSAETFSKSISSNQNTLQQLLFIDTNSLTNRQSLMTESEKRLLFVTSNENLCDTWVCLLNYVRLSQARDARRIMEQDDSDDDLE